jgi:hypothetical protein
MEIVIELIFGFIIGMVIWKTLSFIYTIYCAYRAIKEIDQKFIQAVEKKLEDSIKAIEVDIEKHQDMFYLFNRENSEFVAQGKNKDELVEAINHRFKGYRILAQEERLKELGLDW